MERETTNRETVLERRGKFQPELESKRFEENAAEKKREDVRVSEMCERNAAYREITRKNAR